MSSSPLPPLDLTGASLSLIGSEVIAARLEDPKKTKGEARYRVLLTARGYAFVGPYRGVHAPCKVLCAVGHECSPLPHNVMVGQGVCRICAGQDPATAAAKFKSELTARGHIFVGPYLSALKPCKVICAGGHECSPHPCNVMVGKGVCRICVGNDPATAEIRFKDELTARAHIFVGPYLGANKPCNVICSVGHECSPHPSHVMDGQGVCRICAGKMWDVFYIVTNIRDRRVKFGITSGNPLARLSVHRAAGYADVTRLLTDLPGTVAHDMENSVIATLRLAGEQPVKGREYYDISALGLILDIADHYETVTVNA